MKTFASLLAIFFIISLFKQPHNFLSLKLKKKEDYSYISNTFIMVFYYNVYMFFCVDKLEKTFFKSIRSISPNVIC